MLGALLGGFVKALVDRSLEGVPFTGRSYCLSCKSKLKWYDLFPVLSYLLLAGKCRYCKKAIGIEYLLVEVLMGLLVGLIFLDTIPVNFLTVNFTLSSQIAIELILKIFVLSIFVAVFLTDLKKGIIPDRITIPAFFITLIFLTLATIYKIYLIYSSLAANPLGKYLLPPHSDYFTRHAILAASPFLTSLLASLILGIFFGALILFTKGRGMGGGDLKLGIFMGLALGFPNSIVALLIAFFTGSIVGIVLLILGKKRFGQTIPFGPFLTIGGVTALFWGQKIADWYLAFSKTSIF